MDWAPTGHNHMQDTWMQVVHERCRSGSLVEVGIKETGHTATCGKSIVCCWGVCYTRQSNRVRTRLDVMRKIQRPQLAPPESNDVQLEFRLRLYCTVIGTRVYYFPKNIANLKFRRTKNDTPWRGVEPR